MRKIAFLFCLFNTLVVQPAISQFIDKEFRPQVTDAPEITAMDIQPDGKPVVVGVFQAVGDKQMTSVARLLTNGGLDPTFQTSLFLADTYVRAITIDHNGKILIGGSFDEENKIYFKRFNSDGTQDDSFSSPPSLIQPFKIISLGSDGYLVYSFSYERPVARILYSGEIDESFQAPKPIGYGVDVSDIVYLADGKVIMTGDFPTVGDSPAPKMVRLNADGTLDETFDIGSGPDGLVYDISVQHDGKLVVAGSFSSFNGIPADKIVRLLADGEVDNSFQPDGVFGNSFTTHIEELLVTDDAIFVAGWQFTNELSCRILKMDLTGERDTQFQPPVILPSTNIGILSYPQLAMVNDQVFLTTTFQEVQGMNIPGIVRFNEDGAIDETFRPEIYGPAHIYAAVRQPDGRIIVGGKLTYVNGVRVGNFARLLPDGTLDESFHENIGSGFNSSVTTINLQPDGRILVGGSFSKMDGEESGCLVRLNQNGSRDESFAATIMLRYGGVGINAVVPSADDKVLVGGIFSIVNNNVIHNLVRLKSDGSLDDTFHSPMTEDAHVTALSFQSNGNIIIGGEVHFNGGGILYITDSNGEILNNFSEIDLSNQTVDVIRVFPNDNFIFAGDFSGSFPLNDPHRVYVFNSNGSLIDNENIVVYRGGVRDIHIVNDEEIILFGSFKTVNNTDANGIAKARINGSAIRAYDLNGYIAKAVPVDANDNIFLLMGSFLTIENVPLYNVGIVNFDAPARPRAVEAQADFMEGIINLSWQQEAGEHIGFIIERDNEEGFVSIDTLTDALASVYADTTVAALQHYTYRVRAIDSKYTSEYSDTTQISTFNFLPPAAPTDLSMTYQNSVFQLTWTDASFNEKGFKIERSVNEGDFVSLAQVESDVNTYSDTDIELGTESYTYRLYAFNKFGESTRAEAEIAIITSAESHHGDTYQFYPNPATDFIFITNSDNKKIDLVIMDSAGVSNIQHSESHSEIQVDIRSLPPGMYLMQATDGTLTKHMKLIKR